MPPKKQDKKDPDYKPKTKVETSPRESSIRQLAVRLRDNVIGKSSDEATSTSAQGTSPKRQLSDSGASSETPGKNLKQTIEGIHPYLKKEVELYICNQFKEDSELTSDEEEIGEEEETGDEDTEGQAQQILNPRGIQTQTEIIPIGTAVQQVQGPIANAAQPIQAPQDVEMAAIDQIRASLEEIATSNRRNNPALLSELPYFGIPAQKDTKKYIVESCEEFLDKITAATNADHWTDVGKIRTMRQKLLGPALAYYDDYTGAQVWADVKLFMTQGFPTSDDYPTVMREIQNCKRRAGEQFTSLSVRICKLYKRLKEVAGADLSAQWIETSKKELLISNCPPAVRNFLTLPDDAYHEVLRKILNYLALNTQHHLTKLDIELELRSDPKTISTLQKTPKYSEVLKGTGAEVGGEEVNLRQAKNNAPKTKSIAQISKEKPYGPERMKPRMNFTKPNRIDKYDVYDRMNNQYQSSKGREGGTNMNSANRNSFEKPNQNWSNQIRNMACFNCNRLGHLARNCWRRVNPQSSNYRKQYTTHGNNPNNWQRNSNNKNPNIVCYNCNRRGHILRQCWAKNFLGTR